jgi:hypothetical protein
MCAELNNFTCKVEVKTMNTLRQIFVKKHKPNTIKTESGNGAMDGSVSYVSDTCAVYSIISQTVTNNN